ncbi:MAG: hypothetical protein ACI90V_006301 [Bacillariaceae sp.]|jgi:hypothetical protein
MTVPRGKVGNSQHFPTNLHVLLDEAEKGNHSNIISWCSQGHAFKIHDQDALVTLIAKYFRQTKFKSFLRQLQSYDFHRITRGDDKGVVSHPLFVRGRRSLCFRMSRKPTGSQSQSQSQQNGSGVLLPHSPPQSSSVSATASAMDLSSVSAMDLNSMNTINNRYNNSATSPPKDRTVLSNNIIPLRKINSAPVLFTSINNGTCNGNGNGNSNSNSCGGGTMMMQNNSNNNNHNRLATMNTNLSGMKNATFQYQREERSLQEGMEEPLYHHHSQDHQGLMVGMGMGMGMGDNNNNIVMKKAYSAPQILVGGLKRRASATATMGSANSVFHQQTMKRSSASAIPTMTSEQRQSILQCANIDYSSSTNGGRIPPEAFLMESIKELDGSRHSVAPTSQLLSQQVMIPTTQEVQSSSVQQQAVHQPQYQQQQVQIQYLQEPQQYQQQQQQPVQHRQEPLQHQIQQVPVHHAQQYQQEPQQQHQHKVQQQVEVQYQQEPQQQQVQLVYSQHQLQVPNQVQVQQVKHSVDQMGSCAPPQQQQQDQYQSAKLQLAREVQHIQQQQQQIQIQNQNQNQNQNVQYELSQCDQQQQQQQQQQQHEQIQQGVHQQIQYNQQLVQQQQQDPHHIVQNQQKILQQQHQHHHHQLVQHLRVQNGPVESRQVCSTRGGSDSGCHGSHAHPGSPVCSHQQHPSSKGNPEMEPVTFALYDAVAPSSSNDVDLSISATQLKYGRSIDESNTNGSSDGRNNLPHGRNLHALKFSTAFGARDGGGTSSIGNNSPDLPSSYSMDKVNTAGTNNVNNHNHQGVALVADISLSQIQHTDHTVHPTSNGVGIPSTTPPQSNGNGGYRTTLQVTTTTTNTTVPQQNTTTTPSPSMSQYHQVGGGGGGGGGGYQRADAVHSHSCTEPHHSCAGTVIAAPTSADYYDTVDSLLLDGGGCEEWELRPGDLKEESNQYYGHYSDPCLSNQQE